MKYISNASTYQLLSNFLLTPFQFLPLPFQFLYDYFPNNNVGQALNIKKKGIG